MKFRFHVVALPHTQTTAEYLTCAYTQKVIKFCKMMKSLGHEVYLYASEKNEAPCDELITIVSKYEQQKWFGEYDVKTQFYPLEWDASLPYWTKPNSRAIKAIKKRASRRDFVCLIGGNCQQQIAEGLPDMMNIEYGVGYGGTFSAYKVFESYAHMHWMYGRDQSDEGRSFDTVIPNYFDPKDFTYRSKKDDFYLYLGRITPRKGIETAVEVTRQLGAKLILAGQGVLQVDGPKIIGEHMEITGNHVKYMGSADTLQRAELLCRAKAVFACTNYLEPFGGVAIEAMLCGTPVITTDWGAFAENVIHGQVGYRTRTLGEAIWAAKNVGKLDPKVIHKYAMDNFTLNRVRHQYQAYFEQLNTLWEDNGWYSNWDNGISKYKRYNKYYP